MKGGVGEADKEGVNLGMPSSNQKLSQPRLGGIRIKLDGLGRM